jgi:hypothetical protein
VDRFAFDGLGETRGRMDATESRASTDSCALLGRDRYSTAGVSRLL